MIKNDYTVIATLGLFLSSCTVTPGLDRHVNILEDGFIAQKPMVSPVKSVSTLREGIACMDMMLRKEQVPTTLVAVKNIPDSSGIFFTGTKDMLITALSRMSRTSHAFRVVDYEIDPLSQDTVQTMTGLLLSSGLVDLQKPDIYISGSVTFGDKTVNSKKKSIGLSTAHTDTGYSWDVLATAIGLDLHLGDMNTRTLFPGLDSANELIIGTGGTAFELGAQVTGLPKHVYRAGTQLEVSADSNQGAGAAIRALVDLAAIELIGKWSRVPYWQCIAYDSNSPDFIRQMSQWYEEMSFQERVQTMQRALMTLGYWHNVPDGKTNPEFRTALMQYQSGADIVPSGKANFETYVRLLSNYIEVDAENNFARVGWLDDKSDEGKQKFPDPPLYNPLAIRPGSPMEIELIGGQDNNVRRLGDVILLRITPPQSGYLYCYYRDSLNRVTQIYPNILQNATQVQGGRSVLVPDFTNMDSFTIEASNPGKESAMCALSNDPLTRVLPDYYLRSDLSTIDEITDFSDLTERLSGKNNVIQAKAGWEILNSGY